MIWSHPFETWPGERAGPHPAYEGPSMYRPVFHAVMGATDTAPKSEGSSDE